MLAYLSLTEINITTESAVCNSWPASSGTTATTTSTTTATTTSAVPPVIVTPEDVNNWTGPQPGPNMPIQDVIKSLINFLASR